MHTKRISDNNNCWFEISGPPGSYRVIKGSKECQLCQWFRGIHLSEDILECDRPPWDKYSYTHIKNRDWKEAACRVAWNSVIKNKLIKKGEFAGDQPDIFKWFYPHYFLQGSFKCFSLVYWQEASMPAPISISALNVEGRNGLNFDFFKSLFLRWLYEASKKT